MAKNNKVNGTCVEKKKEREKEKRDGRVRENILKEVKVVNSVFYNWSTDRTPASNSVRFSSQTLTE